MNQFDTKMTELADAIKAKNENAAAKLSIAGMIEAVNAIEVGGGDIVLPDGITVTPANVLDGVFYINAAGAKVEGTMPNRGMLNITLSDQKQTFNGGYYSRITVPAQSNDIPDGYADVSGVTATSANVLETVKFVGADGVLTEGTMPNHGKKDIEYAGREISLDAGYYSKITITESDSLFAAYRCTNTYVIQSSITEIDVTGGISIDFGNVSLNGVFHQNDTDEDIWECDSTNEFVENEITYKSVKAEISQDVISSNRSFYCSSFPSSVTPDNHSGIGTALTSNRWVRHSSYSSFPRAWVNDSGYALIEIPEGSYTSETNAQRYFAFVSANTSDDTPLLERTPILKSTTTKGTVNGYMGAMVDCLNELHFEYIQGGVTLTTQFISFRTVRKYNIRVTLEDGTEKSVANSSAFPYASNPYLWSNDLSWYDVYSIEPSDANTVSVDINYKTNENTTYTWSGYRLTYNSSTKTWTETGSITQSLTSTGYIPEVGKAYSSNGAAMLTLYPDDASGGGTCNLYECASYDNGETIPAYSNIIINGLTSPSAANGTYILQDVESTGTDRNWRISTGYKVAATDGYWYIYDEGKKPSYASALYRSPVALATTSEGTAGNPVYWDDALTDSADRYITEVYNTGDYTSSGNKRNFYVKLKAGTPYQMGVTENGNDNVVRLYDLTGKTLAENDGNSIEINGASCSDAFTYTPTADGIYRFEAGAWSDAVGDVQAVCYPAPEVANAPTATEPWELEWEKCGYPSGAYMVYGAGSPEANGEYTANGDTQSENTIWTNTTTGAIIKARLDGNWMWEILTDASASKILYRASWTYDWHSPWDVPAENWNTYQGVDPTPTCIRGQGQAEGTIALSTETIPERPATGVKTWTGYKATQDVESGLWTIADTATTSLTVMGVEPIVGRIYSADTTIQVARLSEAGGKMVCLAHFDGFNNGSAPAFTDATHTCIIQVMPQANVKTDIVKFGTGSWWGNYRNLPSNGCFAIKELPVIAGDFTIEFWQYYTGYAEFGGTFLYTYTGDSVAEIIGVEMAETDVNYRKNQWFHRAFVRQGTTVTEYINGVKVGTSEFTVALGGDRYMVACGGGTSTGDVRNYIDEFAIFNYAKYRRNFVPIELPYDDIPSGLITPDTTVRDVSVSGIKSITFANSKSYALVDSTATGSSRRWATVDNKWFIFYDAMYYMGWVIGNEEAVNNSYSDDAMVAAYLQDDMGNLNPIGNGGWQDYYTKTKVKVTAN